jgi:hypothetical protein
VRGKNITIRILTKQPLASNIALIPAQREMTAATAIERQKPAMEMVSFTIHLISQKGKSTTIFKMKARKHPQQVVVSMREKQ